MARELPARTAKPVLVVSADDTLREACLAEIRAGGWPGVGAATCEEALRFAARIRFRAVVFDVAGAADWFHCRRLHAAIRGAPLVVLSASCTPDRWFRGVAQRIGCAGFLAKPCAAVLVRDALHRTCAGEAWVEYVGT